MQKVLGILVVTCFVLIIFSSGYSNKKGVESSDKRVADQQHTLKQIITEIEKHGISEVNIYKSERHGVVGKSLVKKLSSSEECLIVLQSIKTAVENQGIHDTATPNFDFVIQLKNNDRFSFHYWLEAADNMRGMFVIISDTGTSYMLSDISTQELLKLVE